MIYNLRPVHATVAGDPIAPLLVRSSAPFAGGDQSEQLAPHRVRTVVDLRDRAEARHTPPWEAGLTVHSIPIFGDSLATLAWESLPDLYEQMITNFGGQLASAVSEIGASLDAGPVLVHCTAGKDRTGLVVALILSLLGASEKDIHADYLASTRYLTDDYLAALASLQGIDELPGLAAHRATSTDLDALGLALDLVRDAGGARSYLLGHGMREDTPELLVEALLGVAV